MKMVNNGYVSRVPQDLEGTIEELQGGGSGSGLVIEKILAYTAIFGPANIPANSKKDFYSATFVDLYDSQTSEEYTLTPEEGAKTLFLPATGFQTGDNIYCLGWCNAFYDTDNSEIGCFAMFYNLTAADWVNKTLQCAGVALVIS